MLLTLTTTHRPATDLGYLLHKHPDRVQEFAQSFGTATVFYPEADEARCTAALVLEIDPVRLARAFGRNAPDFSLAQYVNDRPYAASSLLATALADVFSTARSGRCAARQDLADSAIPLQIAVPVVPCRGGPELARRFFEPLGWQVEAYPIPLDPAFPDWGPSRYVALTLTGTLRLSDALSQLHILLPALDESKHYWQGPDEVDKLFRSGEGWLATHPDRELITRRYLGRRGGLMREGLARLAEVGDETPEALEPSAEEETALPAERRPRLNEQRQEAVVAALLASGATSVIDLGCGPGALLSQLVKQPQFRRVAGTDVSVRSLQIAARRLHVETMSERQSDKLQLFQSALTYEDARFAGFDAAVVMEVIEHVDPSRHAAVERVVFGTARPGTVVVTTPNREYNALYDGLTGLRHADHRFEWDRAQFREWAEGVGAAYGYSVAYQGIGDADPGLGTPTQMAVFTRE